jgi:hypothetical protein
MSYEDIPQELHERLGVWIKVDEDIAIELLRPNREETEL